MSATTGIGTIFCFKFSILDNSVLQSLTVKRTFRLNSASKSIRAQLQNLIPNRSDEGEQVEMKCPSTETGGNLGAAGVRQVINKPVCLRMPFFLSFFRKETSTHY